MHTAHTKFDLSEDVLSQGTTQQLWHRAEIHTNLLLSLLSQQSRYGVWWSGADSTVEGKCCLTCGSCRGDYCYVKSCLGEG